MGAPGVCVTYRGPLDKLLHAAELPGLTGDWPPTTLTGTVLDWLNSEISTQVFCGFIALIFLLAWRHLKRERNHLAALNNYILMKYRLGMQIEIKAMARDVVNDITRIEESPDELRRQTGFDGLWKRAVRLEGSVAFWVDLLQKLGLLGTVLGLGFSLSLEAGATEDLLKPLSMAVWTTVVGLVGGIVLSWRFGRDVDAEVDAHEEHLKEWQAALTTRQRGARE